MGVILPVCAEPPQIASPSQCLPESKEPTKLARAHFCPFRSKRFDFPCSQERVKWFRVPCVKVAVSRCQGIKGTFHRVALVASRPAAPPHCFLRPGRTQNPLGRRQAITRVNVRFYSRSHPHLFSLPSVASCQRTKPLAR
jgi:hypothetical protein